MQRKKLLKVHPKIKPYFIKTTPTLPIISNIADQIRSFVIPLNPNSKFAPFLQIISNFERSNYDGKKILKKGKIRVMGVKSNQKNGFNNKITPATGCHQVSLAFYEALKQIEIMNNVNLNPRVCREVHSPTLIHSTVLFDLNGQTYEANLFQKHTNKIKPISKEDAKKRKIIPPKIISTKEYRRELQKAKKDFLEKIN